LLITGEPPKRAEDRKKPNPSACTGLAEHLLPRRHELIQSFLSADVRTHNRFQRIIFQSLRNCQLLKSGVCAQNRIVSAIGILRKLTNHDCVKAICYQVSELDNLKPVHQLD